MDSDQDGSSNHFRHADDKNDYKDTEDFKGEGTKKSSSDDFGKKSELSKCAGRFLAGVWRMMESNMRSSRRAVYGDTKEGNIDLKALFSFFRLVYDEENSRRSWDTVVSTVLAVLSVFVTVLACYMVFSGVEGFRALVKEKPAVGDFWVLALSNGGGALVVLAAATALFQSSKNYGERAARHADLMARRRLTEIMFRLVIMRDDKVSPEMIEKIIESNMLRDLSATGSVQASPSEEHQNKVIDTLSKILSQLLKLDKQDSE